MYRPAGSDYFAGRCRTGWKSRRAMRDLEGYSVAHLHIMLLVGAVPAGILALIVLFAMTLTEIPAGPEDAREVVKVKAAIKSHKRLSAILASVSALLFLAFALT